MKCSRTACQVELTPNTVKYHIDTERPYCLECAAKINKACNQELVVPFSVYKAIPCDVNGNRIR